MTVETVMSLTIDEKLPVILLSFFSIACIFCVRSQKDKGPEIWERQTQTAAVNNLKWRSDQ